MGSPGDWLCNGVLPLTQDRIPGEWLQHLLAIPYSLNPEELKTKLSIEVFERLVFNAPKTSRLLFECAELHENRTMMMTEFYWRPYRTVNNSYMVKSGKKWPHSASKPLLVHPENVYLYSLKHFQEGEYYAKQIQ